MGPQVNFFAAQLQLRGGFCSPYVFKAFPPLPDHWSHVAFRLAFCGMMRERKQSKRRRLLTLPSWQKPTSTPPFGGLRSGFAARKETELYCQVPSLLASLCLPKPFVVCPFGPAAKKEDQTVPLPAPHSLCWTGLLARVRLTPQHQEPGTSMLRVRCDVANSGFQSGC